MLPPTQTQLPSKRVLSDELFNNTEVIHIEHNGQIYVLRKKLNTLELNLSDLRL